MKNRATGLMIGLLTVALVLAIGLPATADTQPTGDPCADALNSCTQQLAAATLITTLLQQNNQLLQQNNQLLQAEVDRLTAERDECQRLLNQCVNSLEMCADLLAICTGGVDFPFPMPEDWERQLKDCDCLNKNP